MRGPFAFSPAERVLMFAFGSHLNARQYFYGSHTVVAEALGVDLAVFAEIAEDIATSNVDEKIKPVLRLVEKLTLTPARVVQVDADAVLAAGWDEAAYFDAVLVCALNNFMNRLVDGTGVDIDDDGLRAAGLRMAQSGYGGTPPEAAAAD
jgi:alkylhydroperoxidase family enzyme